MSGLRHRLVRLERGATTTQAGVAGPGLFESAYDGLRLLEADLRNCSDSWTADQRAAMAELASLGWLPGTRFADLLNDEFELLAKLARQRFAPSLRRS